MEPTTSSNCPFGENMELYGKPLILKPSEYSKFHMYLHLKEDITEALRNFLSTLSEEGTWDKGCVCRANKEDGSFLIEIPDTEQEMVAQFSFEAKDCLIFHVKETFIFPMWREYILLRCGDVRIKKDGCPDTFLGFKKDQKDLLHLHQKKFS